MKAYLKERKKGSGGLLLFAAAACMILFACPQSARAETSAAAASSAAAETSAAAASSATADMSAAAASSAVAASSAEASIASSSEEASSTSSAVSLAVLSSDKSSASDGEAASVSTLVSTPKQVTGLKASAKTGCRIKLSWNAVSGATGYQVFRKTAGGSWKKIAAIRDADTTSYIDTGRKEGKTYYYKVRAYNKSGDVLKKGKCSSTVKKTAVQVKTVSGLSVEKDGSSITVSWSKDSYADGYQIYRKSGTGKWKKVKTIKDAAVTTWTNKVSGSKYQYKVRAYLKTDSGICKGSFSDVKSVGYVICIDAGHQTKANNGTEPLGPGSSERKKKVTSGTVGVSTGLAEYELNLKVAKKLKKELESRGYEVVMTRTTNNVNISNAQRAKIANKAGADAYVRIHANGSSKKSAHGAMTICQTSSNPYNASLYSASRALSEYVLDGLVDAAGCKKLKVWETDTMTGINWSEVPVTIVEMGYMTNAAEDKKLAKNSYQNKLAAGIADGIENYLQNYTE